MTIKFKEGHLSIKADNGEVSVAQATVEFEEALANQQIHSPLLYDCAEVGEPYFGSVANWVEAIGKVDSQCGVKIITVHRVNRKIDNQVFLSVT